MDIIKKLIRDTRALIRPSSFSGRNRPAQMAIMLVLVSLLFLLITVPMINTFVRNETQWSVKAKKTTTAFHLAEAGVDRAKWKFAESTDIWTVTSTGPIAGYSFDKLYNDVTGGVYAIKISSDPADPDKRIVEAVGKDVTNNEVRRIKAVFENSATVGFATRAENQVSNTGGNDHVEWGPVYSGNSIVATGRTFPRFYSARHVTPQDGGSTSPGTDGVYWWSYYAIPPRPIVPFALYLASATTAPLNAPNGCGNGNNSKYYWTGPGAATFKGCHDTSNRAYYITTDVDFNSGGGGNFIHGTMIILGSVNISGNGGADGSYQARLPPEAWKEYGHNAATWAHYKVFDPGGPVSYAAAVSSNYLAMNGANPKTYPLSNVLVRGFIYTGGSQGLNGGGNCNLNGSLLAGVNATMTTSGFCLYYDDSIAAAIPFSGVNIVQRSWYEVSGDWPSGL